MSGPPFTRECFDRLALHERSEFMYLQTAPASLPGGAYLPDGARECGNCSTPTHSTGLCSSCSARWQELHDKALGVGEEAS